MNSPMRRCLLPLAIGLGMALQLLPVTGAMAQGACPEGSYAVTQSADGSTLSILFDQFVVSGDPASGPSDRGCDLQIPLNLPEGMSLGVYRVDYRGFAHLAAKERANLTVVHYLGAGRKGHRFSRKVNGSHDGDFDFTENIGAGLMKRAGCGEAAVLNVSISLGLESAGSPESMATLDSADGAPKGGLVYHLDTKPCRS